LPRLALGPAGRAADGTGRSGLARLALPAAIPTRKLLVGTRASSSWDNHTPDRAFDGNRGTMWNAGDYAPQWIEADLGAPTRLASLRLGITQLPAGPTTHEVWVSDEPIGADRSRARLVHIFSGRTDDNQRLRLDFPNGSFARYVQVHTTQSPSWVAWAEVEVRVDRPDGRYVCATGTVGQSLLHVPGPPLAVDAPDKKMWATTFAVGRDGPEPTRYLVSPANRSDLCLAPDIRDRIDRPLPPVRVLHKATPGSVASRDPCPFP
jgi:hypothetical protein